MNPGPLFVLDQALFTKPLYLRAQSPFHSPLQGPCYQSLFQVKSPLWQVTLSPGITVSSLRRWGWGEWSQAHPPSARAPPPLTLVTVPHAGVRSPLT